MGHEADEVRRGGNGKGSREAWDDHDDAALQADGGKRIVHRAVPKAATGGNHMAACGVAGRRDAAGRLADRVPNGLLCAAGGVLLALGLALTSVWPAHDTLWPLVIFFMLSGLGFGFFQTPNNRNMLLSAPRERSGAAGGMQGTARLLGQTAGAVIMTLLFTVASSAVAPRIGLAVGALLALAGGLVSTLRIGTAPQGDGLASLRRLHKG